MAQAQIDALEKALHQYRLDMGNYPATDQGLAALVTRPNNEAKWQGPYLAKMPPADPWGRPYAYKYPGERSEFDLFSLGKDGQPGGEGEAESESVEGAKSTVDHSDIRGSGWARPHGHHSSGAASDYTRGSGPKSCRIG
jgi:type II secretion system protein G